jgi:hypothetical protein
MKTFFQWLMALPEDRGRTALGIYPPLYGAGQYPPLAQTPGSAGAALALTTTHKKTMDKIMKKGKKKKKHRKHHKKKKD